jgi:hypothetical protein
MMALLLPGCATTVSESGRKIQAVSPQKSELLKNCQRLGQVTGAAGSFLNNGDYGVIYATNDARNKAGLIPGADTVEIISDGPRVIGGTVTGIVYNCAAPVVSAPLSSPAAPLPSAAPARLAVPAKTTDQVKTSGTAPAGAISAALFEKARKCQQKGGVWVNDICVVQIE